MTYQNKIVRYGLEPVDSILFHPSNWRVHPVRQQDAVKGALSKVGWVEAVLINLRTSEAWPPGDRNVATMIDGHMRAKLAAQAGESQVPAIYVDLDPDEENFVLATLDPLGALAVTDNAKLMELVAQQNGQNETIKAALRGAGIDIRQTFAHIQGVTREEAAQAQSASDQKPREPQVYAGSLDPQDQPGAQASKPADREKYPLAIVLDRRDYDRWLAWKTSIDERSDTAALKALLDKSLEFTED